ncbi:histidine kinase dimerization/phospho-acceptor domain-containing protein, partial [Haloferax sp. Atlit-6N]
MEQAFREQSEELELLNRILRHDVRNDLNIILGWAESLEETATGEEEEKLERIRSAGQRAVELTRVARDIAEAISGEEEPELHPVPLDDVLTTEVKNRTAAFDDAAIELH